MTRAGTGKMTGQAPAGPHPALSVEGVSKRYDTIQALDRVSLRVWPGQVHAVVGENGAGKSTLVKIISGAVQPDEGTLHRAGKLVTFPTPSDAARAGIHLVHQELALLPERTVLQNIWVGQELHNRFGLLAWSQMRQRAMEVLDRLGLNVDPDRRVQTLSTAVRQFVEIARALVREARVIMLDEPTAALSPADADRLFAVMAQLRERGVATIYISHRLAEITEVADDVTVLKDGRKVATHSVAEIDIDRLVRLMVGRPVTDLYPPRGTSTEEDALITVEGLADPPYVRDVSLSLHPREIVGVYGLEGHGQDQLLACLAGDRKPVHGQLHLDGLRRPWAGVRAAIRHGLGYVPQDRKAEGLIMEFTGVQNISLPQLAKLATPAGWIRAQREAELAEEAANATGVRGVVGAPAKALSGGNQQKLLLARSVAAKARVFLFNQPTRGVDIGSKADIYALIRSLCEQGNAALVVSPEIPELLGLCDRILVMSRGKLVSELSPDSTEEDVLAAAVTTT